MGSKRNKGKTCAYRAAAAASETGDHVVAREFVPVRYRSQIPVVPACSRCNAEKGNLEHYLTSVLLFGGRLADAGTNLERDGPRRLAKNQKLRRELSGGGERIWTREPSGLVVRTLALPIDGEKVERLVGFIVRGLMSHHWKVVLGPDAFVDVLSLTQLGEAHFAGYRNMRANRVRGNIGNGALTYEGAQSISSPQISIWELTILGGIQMQSENSKDSTAKFGAVTGPQFIKARADRFVSSLNYIANGR
jgi:hypothetical protein